MLPLAIGAASLGAAAFAGYHSLAWRSQLYGRTFLGTPGHGRKLALTYDDGPNDPDTLLLLDILAKHNVKATFFLIGKYVRQRLDIAHKISAAGHVIGNHTYDHPNLAFVGQRALLGNLLQCEVALTNLALPVQGAKVEARVEVKTSPYAPFGDRREEFQRMKDAIQQYRSISGTRLFRPPFGARRPSTLRLARELGYTPVMWTVTCFDWKETTADRVERHAIRQIRGGDVILMHDGGHTHFGANRRATIEATDRLIHRYKNEGFEFVTVSEMMESS